MSTSLAAQLQKLAVPQTSLLQRDKKRPSLLFDPKEAATIDRDTFYEIGVSGLRELQDLNADFVVFENSLFSKTSKNVERAVEDKATNVKLSKTIKRFLMLLSPYLLLKPAHKALEWLINRFLIHEYNQDDFLKLILPYHETNIFVRCVQLFNMFDATSKWHWLRPVQKSGIHLNKLTLFNHAISDIGFLKFLSKMIFDAVYENQTKPNSLTTLYAFYCTTTIGIIERCENITEPQLSAILPPLLKGLSSNIPDYIASTYMITAQLLSKLKCSHKLLNSFVQRITSDNQKHLRTEATLLLIVLYQSQADHFKTIPSSAMRNIAKSDWFTVNLGNFANAGSYVMPLLVPVLQYALRNIKYQIYRNLTDALFADVRVDDEGTEIILRIVLDNCPSNTDEDDEHEVDSDNENETLLPTTNQMKWYSSLLKKLETQFPSAFDKILTETLRSNTFDKHRQALRTLMNFMLSGDVDNSSRTIFEKLYHPNADNRLNAVEYLIKNFSKLTNKDREMFEGAVNVLLLNDDIKVVTAILSMPKNQLLSLLRENNLIEMSVKILINCYKNGSAWNTVVLILLVLICSEERMLKNSKLLMVILPYLFPSNKNELELSSKILKSKYSNYYKFLSEAKSKFKEDVSPFDFGNDMFQSILFHNTCTNVDFVNDFKTLPEKLEIYKFFYVLLLATNLRHNKSVLNIEYIEQITQFLSSSELINVSYSDQIYHYINVTNNCKSPLEGYLECLQITIENIKKEQKLKNEFIDLLNTNENFKVLITILIVALKGCQSKNKEICSRYTNIIKVFFRNFFIDFKEKIIFLANLINVNDSSPFKIDSKMQLRIILIIHTLLQKSDESISWTIDANENILVPSLLIGLINPLKEIRAAVILVLQLIANCICTLDTTYKPLLEEILSRKEEITLDCNQLPFIVGNMFATENNKFKHFIKIFFNIICDTKTPMYISSSLLTIFSNVNSSEILSQVSKFAVGVLKQIENELILLDLQRSSIISNVILRLNENTCKQINIKSSTWDFFDAALRHDKINLSQNDGKTTNLTVLVLEQITREVFANLNPNAQKLLLKTLIEVASSSENPEVVQNIYKAVKKVDLDAELVIDYLNQMKDLKSVKTLPQRKFRRVIEIPTADILDMIEWRYGIIALEFLQDKKKLSNSNILLPVLFDILKKCLDFEEQGAVEYPKQITLSAILHVCNKMEAEGLGLPKTVFNMELIVQCIRASHNPQTHHHALLVLAHTATLIPDQVLHNIMAIFTFMGSSVLRHDDAYSFQIISKIIDTIIPILVKNNSDENEKNVASVLRVFVDVILDVPEHRRMPLFQKLLVTLGTENYLWLFLVLVFEAHVLHKDVQKQNMKNRLATAEKPKRLDIATNITLQFSPPIILKTCIRLLEYIKSLPIDKPDNLMDTDCVTFNIEQHSGKQFRHYKYTIVTFLSGLLSSKQLVNLFAQLTKDDLLTLEPLYKKLIVNILTYIQTVSKTVDKMSQTPQAQYWKVLIHHCYDTMDSINALLTTEMFLLVIRGLIVHNIPTVRRKAMEILNTKLQYQQSFFYTHPDDGEITNNEDLFALIPSLINIIKTVDPESCGETEQELIQQTALLSLKLLIKLLASKNPDKFTSILEFVIDLIKNKKAHGNILASVMLCLAELCNKLRAHAIPGLPRYMPAVIKILKSQQNQETPGLLLLCIITAIQKIVESLPLFLSPYLEKLLAELTVLSAKWDGRRSDPKVDTFVKKLDAIRSNIGTLIPSRILIPTVTNTHSTLLENKQFAAIGPLMNILAENLANLRGNELNEHLPELTNFFVSSLQFRVDCNADASLHTITTVEDHIIKTLTALVLKLSETTFRPLYYKLFDWAIRGDVKTEKVITFYRLSSGIAENLKGLFVLFAGHFIKNASELLDATNSVKNNTNSYFPTDESNHLLIESILTTLTAVFLYDSKNFMDKDRFDTLMQPLVDQLENQTGGIKCLIERGENLVIPCIAQFAVAIADDALWKQLNYQILLKTRHNHPQVRLIGLKCLCEVARKLGEDFLPLLPETIPFLAELLEDEDENVEKSCQKVVQDLEVILGEPLQKYF